MNEKTNHINRRLSDQLPTHAPDLELWQRLSAKLDASDAEAAYQERLKGLPMHSPDQGTWSIISSRLTRIAFYKTAVRIALSAAAGLLLFFTVSQIYNQFLTSGSSIQPVVVQKKHSISKESTGPAYAVKSEEAIIQKSNNPTAKKPLLTNTLAYSSLAKKAVSVTKQSGLVNPGNYDDANVMQEATQDEVKYEKEPSEGNSKPAMGIPALSENAPDLNAKNTFLHDGTLPVQETIKSETETRSILFETKPYAVTSLPSVKSEAPMHPPVADKKVNHFALAMGYLPENINNGTTNSLFHNVDLTASYNKEKVRINTSLGMAYNEEQIQFDMYYASNTPITAMGPGGKLDTLSYEVANLESEYMGTEKHKYVTYNLGFGRKLFSVGRFSTWINAGAGFGIKLSEPDLITTAANSIKGQYNANIIRVSISKPVYNEVNINFVTGIDFNYKILNRLSISFVPISRWYFKPVLSMDNQPTDELTLGFRTGMKFDF